ncbi:MAG: PAS domain-containing protein [Herminiimonas sp.]|nr:PAS domain-containing protein [Herminiimonas sp.]
MIRVPLVSAEPRETFWRTLQTFTVTRVVIVTVLLIYLSFGSKKSVLEADHFFYWQICLLYLLVASGFASLAVYQKRRFLLQLVSQVVLDIVVTSILYIAAGGARTGLGILYLFPLSGAAILAPLVIALFFASAVTLVLLGETAYQMLQSTNEVTITQAGLYGAAFFFAVFAINRLAARLIKQEDLASQRGRALQMQEAINRLVIADMGDGILVIGHDSTVHTCNPAAERMLGLSIPYADPDCKLVNIVSLTPIVDAFFAWAGQPSDATPRRDGQSIFVVIKPGDDPAAVGPPTVWARRRELTAHLKLRFATVETAGLAEDRWVIFMQDVTEIENQAQQLKLASMGRLTASIAHEVRNPLSAISYATSLLAEEDVTAPQTRLLNIISDNTGRLNSMIEDILRLSRKAQLHGEPVSLAEAVVDILDEFEKTHGMDREIVRLGDLGRYRIHFDPLHLREVVVNLLSNAIRYASGEGGSIRIHVVADATGRLELHLGDDGAPISPKVRAHLFEPFYTTSSKGTGLGLYLARELCLNNGAMLDYEYRVDSVGDTTAEATGRFVITLAMAGFEKN